MPFFPDTADPGNAIPGSEMHFLWGTLRIAFFKGHSLLGVVGIWVTVGVEFARQGTTVDRMPKVRVELAVLAVRKNSQTSKLVA